MICEDANIESPLPPTEELQQVALRLADQQLPTGWELVGSSRMARVAHHATYDIYYKEFLPRSPAEKLKALVKGSRATRARLHSEALLRAGFDAPENIAWGDLPGGREYLFTRAVPGEGVHRWLRATLAGRDRESLTVRRQLLRQLGVFIGRMHATGFTHGDLRPSNVLADRHPDRFRFSLIDNERNVQQQPAAGKAVLKNLMQLNMLLPSDLTRTDRWRFFLAWHSQMRELTDIEARLLAREAYLWAYKRLSAKDLV